MLLTFNILINAHIQYINKCILTFNILINATHSHLIY